jgi:serine/threonine protein kinase
MRIDFGLSKQVGRKERAHSIIGTQGYRSPDILSFRRGGYNLTTNVDWWAVSVILFDLVWECNFIERVAKHMRLKWETAEQMAANEERAAECSDAWRI